jgi:APA family basic amino acid/polyamine antiporter
LINKLQLTSETSKKLKFVSLVNLIVANMIGAGVFTTSGFALSDLGSPDRVMLAWLVGGAIALCGALSYGALARYLTESGGEYLFLSRIIHPAAGFIAGWVSLLAGFTGAIAFAALAFETYAQPIFPFKLPTGFLAIFIVVCAALLHGIRLTVGVGIQNAMVGLKLALLMIFIAIAAMTAKPYILESPAQPVSDFSLLSFAGTLVWISLSYSGFNAAVYIAGESERKQTNVPRAMWLGTLIVTLIYLALNAVFLYLAPTSLTAGREDIAAVAALSIGGEPLAILVRSIIALSLLTSVFAMIMAGPRVYARMAADKVFPKVFRFQGEIPRAAIALQAIAAIIVISIASLKDLLSYLGFTLSLSAALTVFCLFLIHRKEKINPVKIPGYPFVPAFFVGSTVLLAILAVYRNPAELIATALTFISGAALYFLLRVWNQSTENGDSQ